MTPLTRRTFLGSTAAVASTAAMAMAADDADQDTSSLGRTPHTRFAVNVEMWWRKLDFLDRIRKAAEFGFPAIEFWPWRDRDIDAIAGLSEELNLAIAQFTAWPFNPGMNDPANHDAVVKEVEASCRVAQRLKCKKMTVVGGNDQPGMTQRQMHANIIKALKRAAPIAEQHDVMLI
ncbi:MAG: TIM barrel protein, partial [Pirellulales bacterium]